MDGVTCPRCGVTAEAVTSVCPACGFVLPVDPAAFDAPGPGSGAGAGFGAGPQPLPREPAGRAAWIIAIAVLAIGGTIGALFLFAPRNDPPPGQSLSDKIDRALPPSPLDVAATAIENAGAAPDPADLPPSNPTDPLDWSNWPEIGVEEAPPADWVPVDDPEAGISFAMPVAPEVRALTSVDRGKQYLADDGVSAVAVVTWFPASPETGVGVQQRLEAAVATLSPGAGSEASTTPVRYRGYPALRLRITGRQNTTAVCALRRDLVVCVGMSGTVIDTLSLSAIVNSTRFT